MCPDDECKRRKIEMGGAKPEPIPESYHRVTPCLTVQGGAKAIEFYAEVFGATERVRFPGPDGTVMHAEIVIGDSVVIIEEEDPQRGSKAPPPGDLPAPPRFSSSTLRMWTPLSR
jgi:PhnB protein